MTPCSSFKQNNCTRKVVNEFYQNIALSCGNCPLECDSVSYALSTSPAEFPSKAYLTELNNRYLNITHTNLTNLLAFNVYYSDLKYTEINQLEKFTFVDLVCSVGGTIGLFIGSSILSVGEIVEMCLTMLIIPLNYKQKILPTQA